MRFFSIFFFYSDFSSLVITAITISRFLSPINKTLVLVLRSQEFHLLTPTSGFFFCMIFIYQTAPFWFLNIFPFYISETHQENLIVITTLFGKPRSVQTCILGFSFDSPNSFSQSCIMNPPGFVKDEFPGLGPLNSGEPSMARPMEGLYNVGPTPFLTKTYELVDDQNTNHVVSWSGGNNSFVIWDSMAFSTSVLPRYFKHNNFSSFVRQLNTYVSILLFSFNRQWGVCGSFFVLLILL